jgi:hypothetical protein
MRRDFNLPSQDIEFLDHKQYKWETVNENSVMRVIIHGYQIPDGYNVNTVKVHVRIDSTYPDSQIDMAYFNPPLSLKSGKTIKNLSPLRFDGIEWQQWSRHRTNANPWRPGIDNLETHFLTVDEWLRKELRNS